MQSSIISPIVKGQDLLSIISEYKLWNYDPKLQKENSN